MHLELEPYTPTDADRATPYWNLGPVVIAQSDARALLGEPHYIEIDQLRTAGGTEDHWTFLTSSKLIMFFKLCVPYDSLYVHVADKVIPDEIDLLIANIFPGKTFSRLERPFHEMKHPNDPAFYYTK